MYSPAANRLRDATAAVRTRSPLGTPPLSASEATGSNLAPSPSGETSEPGGSPAAASSDQLSNIFNAVRQQIQRWGENAKWKIDLVLLDNSQSRQDSPSFRPQGLRVTTSTVGHQGYMLPVSNSTQYPMDYTAQTSVPNDLYAEDLRQQLRDSLERQRYLENIVRSQAEQIQCSQSFPPDANKAIETMRSIYMMSENEQKLRYLVDTKILHKDMEALSRKLRRVTSTLHSIETMELPPQDSQLAMETLLEERKLLKRKLHLAELRLSARDAELEYLHQVVKSNSSSHPQQSQAPSFYPHYETSPSMRSPKPQQQQQQQQQQKQQQQQPQHVASFGSSPKRGPPYLFQQQYSPKMRHDIKPPPQQHTSPPNAHMSALESLGIVADRMLSDPGFKAQEKKPDDKRKNESPTADMNRSKRSIDLANTLLSMPTIMFPSRRENEDVTMAEANAQSVGQQQPSKKARVESSWEKTESPSLNKQEPDARQSPSIAALLDHPSPSQRRVQHNFSPHATPPLAPAYNDSRSHPQQHNDDRLPPPIPGYRPPSPASTPKGRRQSAQQIGRSSSTTHHI